ncbi:MAG: HAD family phosphatase [Anaerolineae bacterium]
MSETSRPQAIIFDMDGLLVDSEPVWEEAESEVMDAYGIQIAPEVRVRLIGLRNDEFLGQLRQIYGIRDSMETLQEAILERMFKLIPDKATPKPGAEDLLRYAQETGIPTAIASSSPGRVIEAVVASRAWGELLPVRCSAEVVPKGKPAPDVYLHAAEMLGISPSLCLALEDSPNGARAAVAAGMTCYAVPDLSHSTLAAFDGVTDFVFDSLHDVLGRLHNGGWR